MGILFNEVKYYTSESRDFSTPSANGGGIGEEIINDTLHSIFPEISATERETGFLRYAKIFVFNESTTREMKDCIFYIKQDVIPPDRLRLFEATEQESISFENSLEMLGSSSAIAAGTSIQIENMLPVTATAADLVGRTITISGFTFTVTASADATHIALGEDITIDIAANTTISTSDDYDTYQDGEDFVSGKDYINSVVKSTVTTGTTEIFIPIVDKNAFEVGDSIILVDGYFRAVYRGGVAAVEDHAVNTEVAIITLDKAYTSSVSIPTDEGFIANGIKRSLRPGEGKSFWLELRIDPSDAIDAELINQFQLGTHFDDITA